jgi:hypothetical protein
MRQLISKLIAAGLSAGVVLLWWPLVMASQGPTSWVLRAVVWTLLFELLLALLAPIEESIWSNAETARRLASRVKVAKQRVYERETSHRRRVASQFAVAALIAAIPVGLIVRGPEPTAAAAPQRVIVRETGPTTIVRVTRVVHVRDESTGRYSPTAGLTPRTPSRAPRGGAKQNVTDRDRTRDRERDTQSPPAEPEPSSSTGAPSGDVVVTTPESSPISQPAN